MKKIFALAGLLALVAISGCNNICNDVKSDKTYIGPAEQTSNDGVMTPEAMHQLGYISDPQMSPDGTKILYGITYTSIEKNAACRNLWVCNPDGSGKKQLTRYAESVNGARWSNDGSSIYFLQGGQLWKAPYKNGKLGKKVQLTDVAEGISNYKISPDEAKLIYVSSIPGPVSAPKDAYPDLDKANAYVTNQLMYRHWDHWVTETPRSYVATLSNGIITKDNSFDILGSEAGIELPTEPFGGAEQLDWAPDSRHIAYSCRKKTGIEYAFSTNTSIYIYDILTGETKAVTTSGGYDTDPVWSPDGTHLAWISMARDGYEADWQRLFVADIEMLPAEQDGQNFGLEFGNVRQLAAGLDADVCGIYWSACGGKIIFPAVTDATQKLFAVKVEDGSKVKMLTKEEWWFGFDKPFYSKEGEIYTTYQSNLFPSEIVKVSVKEGTYTQLSSENTAYFASIGQVHQEKVMLKTEDGGEMLCWVLYPPKFDPEKTWPAIEMFNGGPQSTLDQGWSRRWNFGLMAQQGYVVILPNRHGCTGLGQAWKEQISGDYQGLNMQDYLTAGKWIKSQPWCGKLAGVGASYGGFSAYNLMGIHGDLFDCFISHAGIFDEKMLWYTTEELWFANWDNGGLTEYAYEPGQLGPKGDGITFGGMQQAGAPYAKTAKAREHYANDPEAKVLNWHTPILCIHGMMDYRIPYEQGMAAFNAAQMMGVPSKLIIFPEENHWITRPQNCIFWQREFFSWLEQWMK